MTFNRALISLLLGLLLFAVPLPAFAVSRGAPLSDANQATITVLGGGVTVTSGASGTSHPASSGEILSVGDRVSTATPGAALLTFFDGSEQELGDGTEVLLQALGDTAGGGLLIQIAQAGGVTVNRVAHLGENSTYELQTPNTTALVRGTQFQATVTLDAERKHVLQEQLAVEEGVVEVRLRAETRRLNAGDTITIVPTSGGLEVVGGEPTVSVSQSGTAWTWGNNVSSVLGLGIDGHQSSPLAVSGVGGLTSIVAGYSHMLALAGDGTVWSWGENGYGQLGNGSASPPVNRAAPVPGLVGVVAIGAGNHFSLAVKADGTVWTWGRNDNGELGNGSTDDSAVPVQVSGIDGVVAVAGGRHHSLAVKSDGTLWSWGWNGGGQLGIGSFEGERHTPVQVNGLSGVVGIDASIAWGDHSLALTSDGTVWAWGSNGDGQLGDASNFPRNSPVQVVGLTGVEAIKAGGDFSLALMPDGTVWAWGVNYDGELGIGTPRGPFTDRNTPVQVLGLDGVTAIAAGGAHALALRSDGTVWSWGSNELGQLGFGTMDQDGHSTVAQIPNLDHITAIGAAALSSAAIRTPLAPTASP